jgi:hypothetical protein
MSCTLYWEPAKREKKELPDALKYVLQRRYGGTVHTTVSERDLGYLNGLRDANVKGAQELIDAINEHGDVVVHEFSE